MTTYLDEINRRELTLAQFANHLVKTYGNKGAQDAYRAARREILDSGDITSQSKLKTLEVAIKKAVGPIYSDMWNSTTEELGQMGVLEAAFASKTAAEFAPVDIKTPAKKKTLDYIERSIMSLESGQSSVAGVWSEFTSNNTDKNVNTIINSIRSGYSNGEATTQILRRVKIVSEGMTRQGVENLIRTGTAHYSQQANNYFRDDNIDVIAREVPITTWDSRRSPICTSIEYKYGVTGSISKGWKPGESPIGYPPYHYSCRTVIRSLPKGTDLEGERPVIEGKKGKEAADAFDRKTASTPKYTGRNDKAFEAEQIPVNTNVSKFLREQPIWYVRQALGKTKADAFLSGKLDLSQLTDKQLRPRSIKELGL